MTNNHLPPPLSPSLFPLFPSPHFSHCFPLSPTRAQIHADTKKKLPTRCEKLSILYNKIIDCLPTVHPVKLSGAS